MSLNKDRAFTLVELLIVAAIIGILLALAIPNLLKARISANEANARKLMQTLRDSEYMYFEQDLNNDDTRNFTNFIGSLGSPNTLRDPTGNSDPEDSLIDNTFEEVIVNDDGNAAMSSNCINPKSGYCISWSSDIANTDQSLLSDFGWEASMVSARTSGRRDFAVFSDKSIRCRLTSAILSQPGTFEATVSDPDCE